MQEGTQLDPGHIHVTGGCKRITPILARIGDKWTLLIVCILANGPMRFSSLKRRIDGISQRMLTFSLRGLERNGLVSRTVHASVPPHVEYELTALGRSLLDPIRHLMIWVGDHVDDVEDAQLAYDARTGE